MFYHFRQNNSGGVVAGFRNIIIEAKNADQANYIAEEKTDIYFYGMDEGKDCKCCGDRWSKASSYRGTKKPTMYSEPVIFISAKNKANGICYCLSGKTKFFINKIKAIEAAQMKLDGKI